MTRERDTTREVEAWLAEGVTVLPDRVLDAVVSELPRTRQRHGFGVARMAVIAGLAAAAVIALLSVTSWPGGRGGGPDAPRSPQPTATQQPTATPRSSIGPIPVGAIPAGTHTFGFRAEALSGLRVTVTLPVGWSGMHQGRSLASGDIAGRGVWIGFWEAPNVIYGDPCRWTTTGVPVEPSVDAIVSTLVTERPNDVSQPIDIDTGGRLAKQLELLVPADADIVACDGGQFRSWNTIYDSTRFHQGPGQLDLIRVIDVDGFVVMVDAISWAAGDAALRAEMLRVLDSMEFTFD